jgi:hypothetical protein
VDPEQLARNKVAIANNALPVLLDRAGGSVTITQREFDELASRYGGPTNLTIRMERVDGPEPGIRLTLARQAPRQGDLPV